MVCSGACASSHTNSSSSLSCTHTRRTNQTTQITHSRRWYDDEHANSIDESSANSSLLRPLCCCRLLASPASYRCSRLRHLRSPVHSINVALGSHGHMVRTGGEAGEAQRSSPSSSAGRGSDGRSMHSSGGGSRRHCRPQGHGSEAEGRREGAGHGGECGRAWDRCEKRAAEICVQWLTGMPRYLVVQSSSVAWRCNVMCIFNKTYVQATCERSTVPHRSQSIAVARLSTFPQSAPLCAGLVVESRG